MSLTAGQALSFYEILGPLGAGGMGEVYLARDTRLEREVAIKVLPEELAADDERLRRFDREAKTLASLNHPNVAGIHGIDQEGDTNFLAMELVPGEDLGQRLKRSTLPLDEALDVCRQIAEGLEAAHEAGIVHRDLKPANVRITPEGVVKILDFGLAKPLGPNAPGSGTSTAQLDSALMTSEGMILGTPTYMSPEQARGKPVDRRTDIWAFGCVLFECLTGKRAFEGDAFGDLVVAILEHEPDLGALPNTTPSHVRELVERCLVKDARQRLRDIGEARLALEGVRSKPVQRAASRPMRGPLGWAIAALVGGLCVFGAVRTGPVEVPQPVAVRGLTSSGSDRMPSASPDGRLIAFCSERGGRQRIWLKQLETGGEQVLSDGPDFAPRFAPDGNSVLFLRVDGDRQHVYRQTLLGSDPRKIVDDVIDACWSPDGTQIAIVRVMRDSELLGGGVLVVDVRDGTERLLYRTEGTIYSLHWSPDGSVISAGLSSQWVSSDDQSSLALIPVDGGDVRRLAISGPVIQGHDWVGGGSSKVVYSQSWQAAGDQGGSLSRVVLWDLDEDRRRDLFHAENMFANLGLGTPPVLNGAGVEVVKDDTLVFGATRVRQLLWEQEIQNGRAVAPGRCLLEGESRDRQPVYSPDGSRIRFASNRTGNLDLWELELGGGRLRQLTDDHAQDWDPGFAADGEGILWSSDRSGAFEIWSAKGDGSGARQLSDDGFDAENPTAAQGGDWIVYASANPEKFGIWRVRVGGTSPELAAAGDYVQAEVSNDGRWAACLTLEPHNLRNVLHVVEIETGRLLPFEIEVKADRDRAIVPGRLRWVPKGALSKEQAIAFLGVDDQGRTGVFLQDFHPERDTSATRRPLAGFHDELTTESFDISPDGTRITLSLVEITRKLMLAEGVKGILK